jgi:hypothetical protein
MAILFAALAASMAAPDKPSSAIRLPSVPLPEASSPIIKVAPAPDRHRPSGPVAPPMEIKSEDLRIAPAPSVLAATLGYLRAVPSAPIHQRLTCVVDAHNGTPLNCFPAEIVGTPLTWQQFFVRTDSYLAKPASGNQAEEDAQRLLTAATDRVLNSRVRRDPSVPDTDSARLMTFNIALSAADAHPAPAFQDPLRFGDIGLETPIDGDLMQDLFPPAAMINQSAARVTITCQIETNRKLFCAASANVEPLSAKPIERWLDRYFILASYQAASSVTVAPKGVDGSDVIGKSVALTFRWQMPAELNAPVNDFMPTPVVRQGAIDFARREQLKLPPAPKRTREQSISILTKMLIWPTQWELKNDHHLEDSMRVAMVASSNGRPTIEQQHPGYIAAVSNAVRTSIAASADKLFDDTVNILIRKLQGLNESQLATLAAAAEPIVTLYEKSGPLAHLPRIYSNDGLLGNQDQQKAEDIRVRYLEILLSQPEGEKVLETFEQARQLAFENMAQFDRRAICDAREPMRQAAVSFLTTHGAGTNARLLDLSLKAQFAANPCG